jgi:hypothetical protein
VIDVAEARERIAALWPRLEEIQGAGALDDADALVSAAAVGLVELLWRNSPVEDAHASPRGPSDGEMMAESLHLHTVARNILGHDAERYPFLRFEDHVLDFQRAWAGTERTVRDMLRGVLGAYRKHVKGRVNYLELLDSEEGRELVLRHLAVVTLLYGSDHFGLPEWDRVVGRIVEHLSRPDDPCWRGKYEERVRNLPRRFVEHPAELGDALRSNPASLGAETLDDLISSGVLMIGRSRSAECDDL